MNPAPPSQSNPPPLLLTSRDEDILKLVYKYRFVTYQEILHLLYAKGSGTYVRARASRLAGGHDYADRYYIYRFPLPSAQGNRERIYTLGSLGREILENLGLPVDWAFKPAKLRTFSHSHLLHSLTLSRTVACFHAWARCRPNITVESRLSYELSKNPPVLSIEYHEQSEQKVVVTPAKLITAIQTAKTQGFPVSWTLQQMLKVAVIPDALLLMTNVRSSQRLLSRH